MAPIRVLDPHSANQIAAGEVVERPVSVVKELVENALDSGARKIDVVIEGSGSSLIKVCDDGCGMPPGDMPLAVIRHATSKITRIEDLDHLQSLGFRGEALPSIASVSRLEIVSRPADALSGMSLKLEGGQKVSFEEVGAPLGTTVIVKDLFFNTPARLKFLRSVNTEFGLISDMLGKIALAHPQVRFTLMHPQQIVFQTSGRSQADALAAVLGMNLARSLQPIAASDPQLNWSLEGYISPPNLVRSSRQAQTVIINGRIIRSSFISKALEDGYHTLIANKTYPIAVLHLHIPPDEYDVNVHPTKMEIRFRKEKELAGFIARVVRQNLLGGRPIPSFDSPSTALSSSDAKAPLSWSDLSLLTSGRSASAAISRQNLSPGSKGERTFAPTQFKLPLNSKPDPAVHEAPAPFGQAEAPASDPVQTGPSQSDLSQTDPASTGLSPTGSSQTASSQPAAGLPSDLLPGSEESGASGDKAFLRSIWPVGQVLNTYILATDGQVLAIIDQHAAHERINYEKFLREVKSSPRLSQELLIPIPLEFNLEEEQILLDQLWFLNEMGFVLEQFGPHTYLLRAVPHHSGIDSPERLLRDFLGRVIDENIPAEFDQLLSGWIYTVACKASIKAEENLSTLEMEQLLGQLAQTDNPFTCPHGRPTVIKLTRQELEKRFHRT